MPDSQRHYTKPETRMHDSHQAETQRIRDNAQRAMMPEAPDSLGPKIYYESPPKKIMPNMIPETPSNNRNREDPFYANNKFDIGIHRKQLEQLNMLSKAKNQTQDLRKPRTSQNTAKSGIGAQNTKDMLTNQLTKNDDNRNGSFLKCANFDQNSENAAKPIIDIDFDQLQRYDDTILTLEEDDS